MATQPPKKQRVDEKIFHLNDQALLDKQETCTLRVCIWNRNPRQNLSWPPTKRQQARGTVTETGVALETGIATPTTLAPKGEKKQKKQRVVADTRQTTTTNTEEENHKRQACYQETEANIPRRSSSSSSCCSFGRKIGTKNDSFCFCFCSCFPKRKIRQPGDPSHPSYHGNNN